MKKQEVIDYGFDKYFNGLKDTSVAVGVLRKDGSKNVNNGFTLADLAHVQEYGTVINVTNKQRGYLFRRGFNAPSVIKIPSRPFMRQTFDEQREQIAEYAVKIDDKILSGKLDRNTGLEAIGDFHKQEIQKNMLTKGKFKANHPFTIAKKGSDNELIGDGRLVGAISFETDGI